VARALDADRDRIQAQVRELEQRDAALVAYIANTTHDVMLPLTVLQGHLVAAREQVAGGAGADSDAARVDETLRLAVEESDYLGSLLRNLNARARMDAAGEQRLQEPVDLSALVERVIARHRMIARDRRVSLEYAVPDQPALTLGDVTLLERALSNVVHNAIRYNEADGHVAVVLACRAGRFSLRVSDDGPGLDAEDLPRLTERGYRGNVARTRHPHGMGLGLHITADVVAQHGFALQLKRPDGEAQGLEVLIEGPTAPPEPASEPA
jgi:signal transduction histidine kinase